MARLRLLRKKKRRGSGRSVNEFSNSSSSESLSTADLVKQSSVSHLETADELDAEILIAKELLN
jgi:hypothetical protein